ncbi:MAG: LamG-like jellyroll fold domain-containing protein [Candidatus Thermoplasmatota archaeon]
MRAYHSAFGKIDYAVSEVLGSVFLILIAVIVFIFIYNAVFPLQLPPVEPNVHIVGYVQDGRIVLQHIGGEPLKSYEVYINGSLKDKRNDLWSFGGVYSPPVLLNSSEYKRITVYSIDDTGYRSVVFDGILKGTGSSIISSPLSFPILISTLRTRSVDEDLICYNLSVNSSLSPKPRTYIYRWMIERGLISKSFARLLMPFDTNTISNVKDYSGNQYNGSIFGGITWSSDGKIGGAYRFNGNGYIEVPYCFDNPRINELTVDFWIKTSASGMSIISFNRTKLFEITISNTGRIILTTTGSDGTSSITSTIPVNDDTWHYIAASYDSSTGVSSIYIDGFLNKKEQSHTPSTSLGYGATSSYGYIGKETISERKGIFSTGFETQEEKNNWIETEHTGETETWDTLRYDNFNTGFGSYTSGGSDCLRSSTYKYEGTHSVLIRDNSGLASSFYLTNPIDVSTPGYISIKIDFWWMWRGTGWVNGEDWWVLYYDGSSWITVLDRDYPSGYQKDKWYHEVLYINKSNYNFPTNMKIRFQCDASSDYDEVYIDAVYINATAYSRMEYDFNIYGYPYLNPYSGSYAIAGTGDFDPAYIIYNRTGIDVSNYENIKLSVYYSYKNTESDDFVGLYYLYNGQWIPVFEVDEPVIGTGQSSWVRVEVDIPNDINILYLQFKWMTSSLDEYVAIDELTITGLPIGGGAGLTGFIDNLCIYQRALSPEQIYQNYLCGKDGLSDKSVIVSEETLYGDIWYCIITPNNMINDDVITESEHLMITMYSGGV